MGQSICQLVLQPIAVNHGQCMLLMHAVTQAKASAEYCICMRNLGVA